MGLIHFPSGNLDVLTPLCLCAVGWISVLETSTEDGGMDGGLGSITGCHCCLSFLVFVLFVVFFFVCTRLFFFFLYSVNRSFFLLESITGIGKISLTSTLTLWKQRMKFDRLTDVLVKRYMFFFCYILLPDNKQTSK